MLKIDDVIVKDESYFCRKDARFFMNWHNSLRKTNKQLKRVIYLKKKM